MSTHDSHGDQQPPPLPDRTSNALSTEQIETIFDQASAELRWSQAQEKIAYSMLSVGLGNRGSDDPPLPVFGSEGWFLWLLVNRLSHLKQCFDDIDDERSQNGRSSANFDPDSYVYLQLPRRHRRLHRLLMKLEHTHPWTRDLLDPVDEMKAHLAVVAFRSLGVDATYIVGLRDLGEERTFP